MRYSKQNPWNNYLKIQKNIVIKILLKKYLIKSASLILGVYIPILNYSKNLNKKNYLFNNAQSQILDWVLINVIKLYVIQIFYYFLVTYFVARKDFFEGIRCALIDRGATPNWEIKRVFDINR